MSGYAERKEKSAELRELFDLDLVINKGRLRCLDMWNINMTLTESRSNLVLCKWYMELDTGTPPRERHGGMVSERI